MSNAPFETIYWDAEKNCCVLLDQTLLPLEKKYIDITTPEIMWEAIKMLRVRGAPAIGIAGAFGMCLGVRAWAERHHDLDGFLKECDRVGAYLNSSRPTAVNLDWAIQRMLRAARGAVKDGGVKSAADRLLEEAQTMYEEDASVCRRIGEHGAELLESGMSVLTHCNAGALATTRYGTALAPIFLAVEDGKEISVYADETRPLLQGARLTTWELQQAGVPVTLICDNMAASLMKRGGVQAVIVGTDRTAANGDVCNKIGTYGVALAAKEHGVPFYVAAPMSSIDMAIASGDDIPIEERDPAEIVNGMGKQIAPDGVKVYNPAFDVTPAEMVTALITEKGVVRHPLKEGLVELFANEE